MEETVTISKSEYEYLTKLKVYVQNWYRNYVVCKHCGAYHPEGCICLNCEKSECDE